MRVFFERREELAPGIWHYYFRPERPVSFVPGQYVALRLPYVMHDPRGNSRTFTLTSLPSDPLLSFIVKFQDNLSVYKQVLGTLNLGAEASVGDAMGDVILPKDSHVPLIFVAGGIGLAAFCSIMRYLIEREEQRDITLFYSVRFKSERILQQVLQDYTFSQPVRTIIAPNRLAATDIVSKVKPGSLVYISGSERFVESLRHDLELRGIDRQQIIFDFFDGYADL